MLAPWIISHFPPHRTYVEPYGGAASVLLRKSRSYTEVYNELDGEITQLFRMARDHGARLVKKLEATPFARSEFQNAYKPSKDPVESCRRTIIRSFMGFGSDGVHSPHRTSFRGRSQRSGTTPAHDWANFPNAFRLIISRLQAVVIECQPALKVIASYDSTEALHYIDPPYVHSTRKRVDAARGYRCEMTDADHRELSELLNTVKGAVVLSGYPSPLYEELYSDWKRVEKTGAFADGARKRTEVLWMRNVPEQMPTLFEMQ